MNQSYRHIITFSFTAVLVLFFLSKNIAQTSLTMQQSVAIGLKNNFGIQIQELEGQILASQENAIKKKWMPRLDLGLVQQNNLNNSSSPLDFVNGFYRDNGLIGVADLNWVLFDGFKVRIEKSRIKKMIAQNENHMMMRVENTAHAIMLSYQDVLLKQDDLRESRLTKEYTEKRLQDAKFKYERGIMSEYEVKQIEISVLRDSSICLNKKKILALAEQQLNLVMGNKNPIDYQLKDQSLYSKKSYRFNALQQKMFALNAELQNQYLNLYLSKNSIAFAKSERLPALRLNSGVTENLKLTKFPEVPSIRSLNFNYYLNLSLSYNLFDGGVAKQQIEENKLRKQIEEIKIEEIKIELSNQLQNAVSNYNTQLEIIETNEKLLKDLKKLRESERERYVNGFSTYLDFQLLKQEYEASQKELNDAIFELTEYDLEIQKLTGGFLKYKAN